MGSRTASLARFKGLLEIDPDSLENLLARCQTISAEEPAVTLAPADWERLIQILKHGLDRITAPELRLLCIEHVGEIYEQQLLDADRALRWWSQVLSSYPFQARAAEELERLTRQSSDWRRLIQIYTTAQTRLTPERRRLVQLRLARVHLEELEEPDRSERILLGLWQKEQDQEALQALQRLYEQTGRKDQLANLLRQRIAATDTVEERIDLMLQLGFLCEVELRSPELALDAYREVLKLDHLNRQASEALEQIYLRQERWPELLAIYEAQAAAASSQEGTVHFLLRMARICDDVLSERVRSRELWRRLRELCPDDRALLEEMARRFEASERFAELGEVLERQAALAEPPARARLLERLGRLQGDQLGDKRAAIASWNQVLALEPDNVVALLAQSDLCGQVGAWEELTGVLRRLVLVGEREGRGPSFLGPVLTSLARLEERELGRPDLAVTSWRRILELEPDHAAALDALERLLAADFRWAECIEVLERKAELSVDPAEQLATLLRQAVLYRDGLGDVEAAVRTFQRVLAVDPADPAAEEGLCALYREERRYQELTAQIFSWLETVSEPRLAVRLLQEAAVVYEDQLGQPEKAFLVWQSALAQDPGNPVTASNLERLAASLSRYQELLVVYHRAVEATPSARIKVELLTAMGRCHGLELGELDRAVALLYQALHLDPEAIPALEVLEECYRRTCHWQELLPILRRHAELEREPERLVPLLCWLGELQSRLGVADQALLSYRRALELAPQNPQALSALEALYLAFGLWAELSEILQRQLDAGIEPERRLPILLQLGELHDQQLGDPVRAIACYQEALSLRADQLEVMQSLQRLYDQTGQSEAYLDILERQLDQSDDLDERVTMLERIAGAWEEQFGKSDRALLCLEKLLVISPCHEPAHQSLQRLCRERGDLRQLAEVLRRHAAAVEGSRRVELLLELGSLLGDTLRELELAAGVHQEILELSADEVRALEALASIREKQEQWKPAVAALRRLAVLLEGERAAAALLRLGRILEQELQQIGEAERCYEQAIDQAPACAEAMTRLVEIYRGRAEWERAAQLMVQAEPHLSNLARKAQLLYEAGIIHLERLQSPVRAAELLARTLEADPDHLRAGQPLSRLLEAEGRLAELEPVLDMLARKVDARDRQARQDVCFRLARTAAALGKPEKAIRFFVEARSYDLNHLPTLRGLAELQYQQGDWQEAFKTYQTLLVHHRDALDPAETAEVFFRLGSIKREQGERLKALGYLEKALEQVPTHRACLEATVEIQSQQSNWEAVVRAKSRLLSVVGEEERPRLLEECADLHLQRLGNRPAAIDALAAAAALRPQDRVLLNRYLELLSEAQRWPAALQVIQRLTELEPSPEVRARFLYTAAVIYRDELQEPERALQLFNQALDSAPDHLKAFESIDRLCTAARDWRALEDSYRRMIARQGEQGAAPLRAMLWHNLGEVYRTRLRQLPDAIHAFQAASRLEPENLQRHEILAELYQLSGQSDQAVVEQRILIARDPQRLAAYSALAALYGSLGQADARWCVCAALTLIGGGSAEEQRLHQQSRRPSPRLARGRVAESLWNRAVRHPAQDPRIDALLVAAAPMLTELTARPAKEFGLKRKHRAPATGQVTGLFHHAAALLGAHATELYLRSDQPTALAIANTSGGPSVVLGAPLLGNLAETELAFSLGQQLTYLRPGTFLCRLFPSPSQLRLVVLAAVRLVLPELAVAPAEAAEVARIQEQLAAGLATGLVLPPQLATQARALLEGNQLQLDLVSFWAGLGHTADRVGLLLCGDLHTAARIIQLEPAIFGSISASDRIKELVAYAISPEYLELRSELGLIIA